MSRLKWWLADSATLENIGPLLSARQKSITEDLNQSGSATFRVPINDAISSEIVPVRTCAKVTIEGSPVWSGPVWTISDEADQDMGWTTVACKGWLEILAHRRIAPDQITTISSADSAVHIHALLALANARGPTLAGAQSSTFIMPGQADMNAVPLTRSYTAFQNIGDTIREFTQLENGVDISVDPATRSLNVYRLLGASRDDVIFRLKGGRPTLQRASRSIDASNFANYLWVTGSAGTTGQAQDTDSQAIYGLFENQVSLTNVANETILASYANAEIISRGSPTVIYDVTPAANAGVEVPQVYSDFFLGDKIQFSVERGRLDINRQPARMFGFTLQDGDDGVERLSSIKLEAS